MQGIHTASYVVLSSFSTGLSFPADHKQLTKRTSLLNRSGSSSTFDDIQASILNRDVRRFCPCPTRCHDSKCRCRWRLPSSPSPQSPLDEIIGAKPKSPPCLFRPEKTGPVLGPQRESEPRARTPVGRLCRV